MSKVKLLLASALSVALIDAPTHAAPAVPSVSRVHGVTLAQWHRGGGGMGMGPLALDWPRRRGRGNHR